MTETFYEVLGVAPDASTAEIESAYRDRLKETHPDLSDREDAGETTQRVIRARDVLTDEAERERYDRIGHAAYVGTGEPDDDTVSSAAAAAREAGWGSGNGGDSDSTGDTDTGPRRTRNRHARERAARERVQGDDSTGPDPSTDAGAGRSADTSTDGGTAGSAAARRARARQAARRRRQATGTAASPSWSEDTGYSVRQTHQTGVTSRPYFASAQSFTLLGLALFLYPVMLFSTIFPAFPLVFNVIVGLCTVSFVGYVQSRPEVGVVVFGIWSVLTPFVLAALSVDPTGLQGILALTGTVLPFCLSVASFTVLYR